MPELEYFLVAEATSIDRDENTISIFNVYNERKFQTFPVEIPRLVVVTCWVASEEDIRSKQDMQAEIILRVPGKPDDGPYRANFVCDIEFQHILFEVTELTFDKPCLLEIELRVNGEHQARHRIRLAQLS